MTIHLSKDVESSIHAAVHSGHFASADEAIAEAWRAFQRQPRQGQQRGQSAGSEVTPDPLLGALRDAADELDEIVADAMRIRREETWRAVPGE